MPAARFFLFKAYRFEPLAFVLHELRPGFIEIVGRDIRKDAWIVNSTADPRFVRRIPALARPLPAVGTARRDARLIGAVFALVKLERKAMLKARPDVAPPVGAYEAMCVRAASSGGAAAPSLRS
jgi:hypothetical protein